MSNRTITLVCLQKHTQVFTMSILLDDPLFVHKKKRCFKLISVHLCMSIPGKVQHISALLRLHGAVLRDYLYAHCTKD